MAEASARKLEAKAQALEAELNHLKAKVRAAEAAYHGKCNLRVQMWAVCSPRQGAWGDWHRCPTVRYRLCCLHPLPSLPTPSNFSPATATQLSESESALSRALEDNSDGRKAVAEAESARRVLEKRVAEGERKAREAESAAEIAAKLAEERGVALEELESRAKGMEEGLRAREEASKTVDRETDALRMRAGEWERRAAEAEERVRALEVRISDLQCEIGSRDALLTDARCAAQEVRRRRACALFGHLAVVLCVWFSLYTYICAHPLLSCALVICVCSASSRLWHRCSAPCFVFLNHRDRKAPGKLHVRRQKKS